MYSMHGLNTTPYGNSGKWKLYDIDLESISRHGVLFCQLIFIEKGWILPLIILYIPNFTHLEDTWLLLVTQHNVYVITSLWSTAVSTWGLSRWIIYVLHTQ